MHQKGGRKIQSSSTIISKEERRNVKFTLEKKGLKGQCHGKNQHQKILE